MNTEILIILIGSVLVAFGCGSHVPQNNLTVAPYERNSAGSSAAPVPSETVKRPAAAVYFVDARTGWIITGGILYKTTDGGDSWRKVVGTYLAGCSSVVFATEKVGWAKCDNWDSSRRSGFILITQDGGLSWRQVLDIPTPVLTVNFVNDRVGYVSGRWYPLQRSMDGGKTWTETDGIEGLNYICFTDEKTGYGYGGSIWRTTDGGENWKQLVSYQAVEDLWNAIFVDSITGWIIGGTQVWRTTNGEKWILVTDLPNPAAKVISLDFIDAMEGWLTLSDGSVLHSTDGGSSWQAISTLATPARSVRFITNQKGWMLDTNGKILRTNDGGRTWIMNALAE